MRLSRRLSLSVVLAVALLAAVPASDGWAASFEVLNGPVRAVGHDAGGRAAVVISGATRADCRRPTSRSCTRRTLTLRDFEIDPGPRVRVWLVPRSARGDGQIPRDYKDLGRLKGNRGNQQYTIPGSVDLRRYRSVIFWCVPFTQTLARANLSAS